MSPLHAPCACAMRVLSMRLPYAYHAHTMQGGATLFPCAKQAAIIDASARENGDGGGGGGSSSSEVRRLCSSLVAAFRRDERFLKPSGACNHM